MHEDNAVEDNEVIMNPDNTANSTTVPHKHALLGNMINYFGVMFVATLAVGAVFAGVTALYTRAESTTSVVSNPPITVAVQPVIWSDYYTTARKYIGRLEAVRETATAFERGGLVVEIKFDEGDTVAKNAVIARLDKTKLEANLRELQAQRQELIARRDLARLTMKRQNKLQSRGWSPEQRYDEARFDVSRLNASIARIDAALDALNVDITKSELRAPFKGKVTVRHLDEGAVVAVGTTVLNIIEGGASQARIGIAPEAATELKLGHTYPLTAGGRQLNAQLKAIRADLEVGSRTVTALFKLTEKTDVPLGEIVTLNLQRRVKERGIWLPLAALVQGRKGLWSILLAVSLNDATNPAIKREVVEVLYVSGNRVYVRGALKDGDYVVTTGTNRVTPGQPVVLSKLN